MKPTPPALVSDVGLLIEDPVGIIVRDQPGRKADGWKKFDRSYLQAMAQAILADEKVFELKGKLYDRKTGREVSVDKALEKIPPKRRAELKKYISKDPKIRTSQVRAMVNGDQAFMVGSKLYNLKGVALD